MKIINKQGNKSISTEHKNPSTTGHTHTRVREEKKWKMPG